MGSNPIHPNMTEEQKPKAMLKSADGFIVTKRQMKTVEGATWWQFSKSPGSGSALLSAAQIFEDHGYDVVPWDDDQAASDGSMVFRTGDDGKIQGA